MSEGSEQGKDGNAPRKAEDLVLEKCRAMIGSKTGPLDVYCNRLDPVT